MFRYRLHRGQMPFIKRQQVVFSLGNVYVPSTTPNWENRLPLKKPSVSASCELSGWFLHFIRSLNPPLISPFHLSSCHKKNYSEGSVHPFRPVGAWISNVGLGLHYKKNPKTRNHTPKNHFLVCFKMGEHRVTGTGWEKVKKWEFGKLFWLFYCKPSFLVPKPQIMVIN